jgi:anti-sigma regulatory factor (Ser/Thr protein kinase)
VSHFKSSLELSMAAEAASVRLMRAEILRWLHEQDLDDDALAAAVALATSEAVANVVRHAYGQKQGRVELDALVRDQDIMVRVTDRGLGLRARGGSRTGLGLPVIGRVSNGVTVASDDHGTTVSMRFELDGRAVSRRERAGVPPQLIGIG